MKIPEFQVGTLEAQKLINATEWEIRNGRIIAVKGTNIILVWGSTKELERLSNIVDIHNGNLLLGITDKEYNESLDNKQLQ